MKTIIDLEKGHRLGIVAVIFGLLIALVIVLVAKVEA